MIRRLENLFGSIARLLSAVSAALVAAILVLVTASAIMRYVVTMPFRFTEELVGVLVLASVFLALPLIRLQDRDISVTAVTSLLPPRIARVVSCFALIVVIMFLVLFGWDVWTYLQFAFDRNLKTEVSRLAIWPWVGIMLICLILFGAATLIVTRKPKA